MCTRLYFILILCIGVVWACPAPVNCPYMTVLYIDSVYGVWACHGPHDHGIAHRIAPRGSIRDPQYGAARAARTSPKARGRDLQVIEITYPSY